MDDRDKEKEERLKRYRNFQIGWEEAVKAAGIAWHKVHAFCLDSEDDHHSIQGDAKLVVAPASSSFAKWLKKNEIGLRGLPNGWHIASKDIIPWDEDLLFYPKEAAIRVVVAVLNDMLQEADPKTLTRIEAKINGNID